MKLDDDKKHWEGLERLKYEREGQIIPVEPDRKDMDSIMPPPVDFEELSEKGRRALEEFWGPDIGEA